MIKNLNKAELIKFIVTGGLAFGADYFLLLFLHYQLDLSIKLASVTSYTTAFLLSFVLQKYWTFNSTGQAKKTSLQLTINLALAGFNMVFATYATAYFVDNGILPAIIRPIIFGLIMIWNFIIYKKIIFR